ncbi:MAG: hypothetical protein Q4D16_10725 [Eubacteriales bacterium]|nr:hypothetical protein [Eubacteriales bacterium]
MNDSKIKELGDSLQGLLSILKKNREYVDRHVLKTKYREPYYDLLRRINQNATAFSKEVSLSGLAINPDFPLAEQIKAINHAVSDSGLLVKMGRCLSSHYDVAELYHLSMEMREVIESALRPYVAPEDCLVAGLFNIEQEPVLYNTLTEKVYENDTWVDRKLDLKGKLLIYLKQNKYPAEPEPAGRTETIKQCQKTM